MYNNYWLPLFKSGHFSGRALPMPNFAAGSSILPVLRGHVPYSLPIFVSPSSPFLSVPYGAPSFSSNRSSLKTSCQLKLSGRLNGVSKARAMTWRTGALRPQAISSKIGYYNRQIFTKWGTIGLKLLVA